MHLTAIALLDLVLDDWISHSARAFCFLNRLQIGQMSYDIDTSIPISIVAFDVDQ